MYRLILLSSFLFFLTANVQANNQQEIEQLLAQKDAPFGVVFEIVEGNDDALQWAIPAVNKYIRQLRERFPGIGLAVVSHGSEQFGLMKNQKKENALVHTAVQSLVASDVPVHVCGTHASWRGKTADDFPDYVDVTPAGPTEIRNYEAMGYVLIEIKH
ncbi:MAG: DsrE family protein [Gammaproteobacteria bacterium]|nr:DsrE family protein [Gammaproteobacteria bacterium]MCF6258725.1 DsrE family protein [Gammaproteobacteria bacterium]